MDTENLAAGNVTPESAPPESWQTLLEAACAPRPDSKPVAKASTPTAKTRKTPAPKAATKAIPKRATPIRKPAAAKGE